MRKLLPLILLLLLTGCAGLDKFERTGATAVPSGSGVYWGDDVVPILDANFAALEAKDATQDSAIALNTAKNTYPSADASKLSGIEASATADQLAADVPIADSGDIITATDVEAALQENRTAIDLNTAKVTNATHTGDVTGATELTIAAGAVDADELASTAVTAGNYASANITVDADGRITAASTGSSVGTPGGSDTYVQYNKDGALAGDDGFIYNEDTDELSVGRYSQIRTTGTPASYSRYYEAYNNGSDYLVVTAPDSIAGSKTLTYPTHTGTFATNPKTVGTAVDYSLGLSDLAECYGGTIFVSGEATITACDDISAGMNFRLVAVGTNEVTLQPQSDDLIILDGVALDDNDTVVSASVTGDELECIYYSPDGWYCKSTSWTDGGAGATPPTGYLLELDFEETGTPSEITSTTNSPNFDDTTSPSPLSGTESCEMDGTSTSPTWTAPFTQTNEVWVYYEYAIDETVVTANKSTLTVQDSGGVNLAYIQHRSVTGDIRFYADGVAVGSITAPMTDATKHYWMIRLKYVDGAGSDEAEVWHSSTGTFGASSYSISTLSFANPPAQIYVGLAGSIINLDNVVVDDADLSSY